MYDAEVKRVQRIHGWVISIFFMGAVLLAVWLVGWLNIDVWYIDVPIMSVAFFIFFAVAFGLTEKPMKREIERIRKPLSWLPKPCWRENND